ncbi:hypothetical protein pqer_cds_251 [Pandoravirus quercus]|uniref:Uncharacterized protein n=1 Tax=Pandoravirus quercus TaxID=2107709 RepID=A0A2U7U8C0_9VIRU|nr:hypothetical protein pqer_cds_251 [Pandoravirus quercus]AVK74673.1 hypothetical protein pqer_cds_251 [Pandoravirus quercus]
MTTPRIVYNLTGRPLRTHRLLGTDTQSTDPSWPLPLPPLYEPDAASQGSADDDAYSLVADISREGVANADIWREIACCVGCGIHLGDANARQYCGKTYCPLVMLTSSDAELPGAQEPEPS